MTSWHELRYSQPLEETQITIKIAFLSSFGFCNTFFWVVIFDDLLVDISRYCTSLLLRCSKNFIQNAVLNFHR